MKKFICIFMSAVLLISVLLLSACGKKKNEEPGTTSSPTEQLSKASTSAPVKIVDLPATKDGQLSMFNAALDFFDLYCYSYTKSVKCKVSDVSVGSLSAASNAVDAFKSIFGETEKSNDYDYQTGQESFSANSMKGGFTLKDTVLIDVKQKDSSIILTVTFPNENNPSEGKGVLSRLTTEYVGVENVNSSLGEFSSSAASVNVSVSDIKAVVVLNSFDSSLESLTLSFTERFSLGGVKLVQLDGSSVTGTSKTTVSYSNIE